MIVTLQLSEESRAAVARRQDLVEKAPAAFSNAILAAAALGAEEAILAVQTGRYGVTTGGGALAASISAWMIDPSMPLAAVGVPADSPAARYAAILEHGGTIRPVAARALAVPVSPEARHFRSPRDMPDLRLIKRPGRPALLVRIIEGGRKHARWEIHWVLLFSVTIPGRHWLSRSIQDARPGMTAEFGTVVNKELGLGSP